MDNIHKSSREVGVGSDLVVNLDQSLLDNGDDFLLCQSILKSVSEKNDEGEAFSQFMGTSRRFGGPFSSQLGEHPVGWGIKSL